MKCLIIPHLLSIILQTGVTFLGYLSWVGWKEKICHVTIQFCETAPWEPCYPEEFSWTEAFCVTQEIWTWGDDVWIYDTEELTVTTPGQGR